MEEFGDIETLATLVRIYFALPKGALIESPDEVQEIVELSGLHARGHPHFGCSVGITRRALKHFVEERTAGFLVRHSAEEALDAILFAVCMLPEILLFFDLYELDRTSPEDKHFYSKGFFLKGLPSIRILVEPYDSRVEIKSIHFRTRRR